jgi:hypothetical protein
LVFFFMLIHTLMKGRLDKKPMTPEHPFLRWMYDRVGPERYLQGWVLVWLAAAVAVAFLATSGGCE